MYLPLLRPSRLYTVWAVGFLHVFWKENAVLCFQDINYCVYPEDGGSFYLRKFVPTCFTTRYCKWFTSAMRMYYLGKCSYITHCTQHLQAVDLTCLHNVSVNAPDYILSHPQHHIMNLHSCENLHSLTFYIHFQRHSEHRRRDACCSCICMIPAYSCIPTRDVQLTCSFSYGLMFFFLSMNWLKQN